MSIPLSRSQNRPAAFATERGLLPADLIAEARDTLADLFRAVGAEGPDDLDALADDLIARDRPRLGAVYDVMRETEVFRRIITAEPLRAAAAHTALQDPR